MVNEPGGDSPHEQASSLLEAYVLDALEPEETAVVDAHLDEGCEDCEDEVGLLRRVLGVLPLAGPIFDTSAELKRRVLREAAATPRGAAAAGGSGGATRQAQAAGRASGPGIVTRLLGRFGSTGAVAASIGVMAFTGLLVWNVVLQTQMDDLESENSALESSVVNVRREVEAQMTAALLSLSGTATQTRQLSGTANAPDAFARLMLDAEGGDFVMVASGLSPTHDGTAYVIWMGGVQVGHFYVDETGSGIGHGRIALPIDGTIEVTVSHEVNLTASAPSGELVLRAR